MELPIDASIFDAEVDRRRTSSLKYINAIGLEAENDDIFIATVADMDFLIPAVVQEAIQSRLNHGIFGYEAPPVELLPSVASWLKRRHGWIVESTHIVSALSVVNTLATVAALFSNDGDAIIIQPPVFIDFSSIAGDNCRQIIANPLQLIDGQYFMDFDDLEKKAALESTKLLFLCNPQNPIGRIWTADELRTVGEICLRHNVLLVSDEMHADMVHYGSIHTPVASISESIGLNTITCISPGKTFNIASCCSSFAVVQNEVLREKIRADNKRMGVTKQNALGNAAMVAAYQSGASWLDSAQRYIQCNIDIVRAELQQVTGIRLIEPQATFLVWLDCRELGMPPKVLSEFFMQKAKWMIVSGDMFGGVCESKRGLSQITIEKSNEKFDCST